MKRLGDDVIQFFHNQGCVIVSTIDKNGFPHGACKGIVQINRNGRIYLLDLYRARTYDNLKQNSYISITAIDEHKFMGYCLKGKAEIISEEKFGSQIIKAWEARITSRLTRRVLKNIREEKGHPRHPEALLPRPEYLIVMEVEEIVDLTPHHLK
ncbi:MAG: pyridoxamine 5'-phosphate oxidase family protein [Candidatus Omnitrophota bacterium]|nr:pyridoxamine 5'-phosphate oxidase family protein [Candidatus Omnitrophota bacterium]